MSHVLQRFERNELVSHYREFIARFPEFVDVSRDTASDYSESHREFEVGNIGVIAVPGVRGLLTVTGANLKIKHHEERDDDDELFDLHDTHGIPRDTPPVCAEMATVNRVHSDESPFDDSPLGTPVTGKDVFFIAHVTTASTNRSEIRDVTGVDTETLPPCSRCTQVLDKSDNTSKATLYVSAGLDDNKCQVRNIRLLKNLHKNRLEKRVPVGRVGAVAVNNVVSPITQRSLEYFDARILAHSFADNVPSRTIATFARHALTQTPYQR